MISIFEGNSVVNKKLSDGHFGHLQNKLAEYLYYLVWATNKCDFYGEEHATVVITKSPEDCTGLPNRQIKESEALWMS